ncbi:MAG: DUF1858 domain-containing protein [Eubacteriales bacterium]|nr:DUF1858 domain-containing protein [Eubacteriales bacterium]
MANNVINKEMIITEVLQDREYLVPVFYRHGLFCLGCVMAHNESLEEASFVHGISCDALVNDLNAAIEAHQAAESAQ